MRYEDAGRVLGIDPFGLVLDYDKTLAEAAESLQKVRTYRGVSRLLARACACPGVHVAILTGRPVEDFWRRSIVDPKVKSKKVPL